MSKMNLFVRKLLTHKFIRFAEEIVSYGSHDEYSRRAADTNNGIDASRLIRNNQSLAAEDQNDDENNSENEYDDDEEEDNFANMNIFQSGADTMITIRVEKIPAKQPKLYAFPLKSALKKPFIPINEYEERKRR